MPRAHRSPSSPSSSLPPSPNCVDDAAAKTEREGVERRRSWLSTLPQTYAPKHRERYVFLHLDNTTASLVMSRLLFRSVAGAQCPHDIRLDFEALTDHLCGTGSSVVSHQMATYSKTKPNIAHALEKFGWTLKANDYNDTELRTQLLTQLQRGAATANGKTLVLATGGGALSQDVVSKFLVEGWHVEIHAWLRALSDGYLRLQMENPGRVVVKSLDDVFHDIVFLKKRNKSKGSAAKHVCSILNYGEAPLKVVASPASDTASTPSPFPRAASVSPTQRRMHTVPPAMSPNASWIKAATQDEQTPCAASPASESSSIQFTSPLKDFVGAAPFFPAQPRMESNPPAVPSSSALTNSTFVPPLPPLPPPTGLMPSMFPTPWMPMPPQPAYRWMLCDLQLQQIRDVISAQQADLAMQQCPLQQTTELMRLMQDQEKMTWQPVRPSQPPNAALSPWSSTWGF